MDPDVINGWLHAALSLGVGGGGIAMLIRALIEIWKMRERGALHREDASAATAKTVQSAMDSITGAKARLEQSLEQAQADYRELAEQYDALVKLVATLRAENRDLRTAIALGAQHLPQTIPPESLPPPAIEAAVSRALKDER